MTDSIQDIEVARGPALANQVTVMADALASGLWDSNGVNVDISFIPMSAGLVARLSAWSADYDTHAFTFDEPVSNDWLQAFVAEGLSIAKALKAENPSWKIIYFDEAATDRDKTRIVIE